MPGIGVINNPRSRQNRKNPDRINTLGYILGERGVNATTKDLESLREVIEEFKEHKIDILAINGGDGSNHVTLTTLIKVYGDEPLPKIAFLRGGTYNTISDALGIKGTPESIMFNIVDKYHNGLPFETVEVDIMKIGDRYGFIFGNGVIGNFMEDYYAGGPPTVATGAKTLWQGIQSFFVGGETYKRWYRPIKGRVVVDGLELPRKEFFTTACMSVPNLGLQFKPAYRAFDEPGTFHFIGIFGSAGKVIKNLVRVWFGRPWPPEIAYDMLAKKVELDMEEGFTYTIDGDMHRAEDGKLTIETGPRLTVIRR